MFSLVLLHMISNNTCVCSCFIASCNKNIPVLSSFHSMVFWGWYSHVTNSPEKYRMVPVCTIPWEWLWNYIRMLCNCLEKFWESFKYFYKFVNFWSFVCDKYKKENKDRKRFICSLKVSGNTRYSHKLLWLIEPGFHSTKKYWARLSEALCIWNYSLPYYSCRLIASMCCAKVILPLYLHQYLSSKALLHLYVLSFNLVFPTFYYVLYSVYNLTWQLHTEKYKCTPVICWWITGYWILKR